MRFQAAWKFLFVIVLAVVATGCPPPQNGQLPPMPEAKQHTAIACSKRTHDCHMYRNAPTQAIAVNEALKGCGEDCNTALTTTSCGALAREGTGPGRRHDVGSGKAIWEAKLNEIETCHVRAQAPCKVVLSSCPE